MNSCNFDGEKRNTRHLRISSVAAVERRLSGGRFDDHGSINARDSGQHDSPQLTWRTRGCLSMKTRKTLMLYLP